jgi:hypothetical protein
MEPCAPASLPGVRRGLLLVVVLPAFAGVPATAPSRAPGQAADDERPERVPLTVLTKTLEVVGSRYRVDVVTHMNEDPRYARPPGQRGPGLNPPRRVEVLKTRLGRDGRPEGKPVVIYRALTHASAFTEEYNADAVADRTTGRIYLVETLPTEGFTIVSFSIDAEPVGLDGRITDYKLIRPVPEKATPAEKAEIVRASIERNHFRFIARSPEGRGFFPLESLELEKEGDTLIVHATLERRAPIEPPVGPPPRLRFDYSLSQKRWTREDPGGLEEIRDEQRPH